LRYLVRRGQVCLAIDGPHDRATAEECLAAIERIYVGGTRPIDRATREDVEMALLVASWFRSRPDELQRTFSPEEVQKRLRAMRAVSGVWADAGRRCGSTVSGSCRTVVQRK
jgi:hypothetical protein